MYHSWSLQVPNSQWMFFFVGVAPSTVLNFGQRTEHVKTGHAKTDRFRGHFCGHFRGHPRGTFRGAFRGESSTGWSREANVRGHSCGHPGGRCRGRFRGPTRGRTRGPTLLPKPTCRRTTRTNITIQFWASQSAMSLWGSRLHGFVSHRFFARIFCTDFSPGFFARIVCTDFLHGFSAQIFCTVFCPIFLHGFLHGLLARIVCTDVARIFARIFFGVSQNTCWEAPKFHRENPPKNSPCFGGLLGRGSGGRRVRWDSGQPDQARVSEDWGVWGSGADGESSHGLGPKLLKVGSKSCQAKECWEREAWADHELRSWAMFQVFHEKNFTKNPLCTLGAVNSRVNFRSSRALCLSDNFRILEQNLARTSPETPWIRSQSKFWTLTFSSLFFWITLFLVSSWPCLQICAIKCWNCV